MSRLIPQQTPRYGGETIMSDVLQHAEAFIELRNQVVELLKTDICINIDGNQVIGHEEAAEAIILFFAGRASQ